LRLVADHALKKLRQQLAARRQCDILLLEQLLGSRQSCTNFAVGDRLGIDHHHDEVGLPLRACAGSGWSGETRRGGRPGDLGLHGSQGQRKQEHQRSGQRPGRKICGKKAVFSHKW
jgi:hypothetical protein